MIKIIIEIQDPLNRSFKMIEIGPGHNILIRMIEDKREINTDNKDLNIKLNTTDNKEPMTEPKAIMIVMTEGKSLMSDPIKDSKEPESSQDVNRTNQINQEIKANKELVDIIEIIEDNSKDKITISKE